MQRKAVSSLPENDEMQNPNTGCIHFCDTASSTSYLEIQTTSSAQPPPPPPWVPYFPPPSPDPPHAQVFGGSEPRWLRCLRKELRTQYASHVSVLNDSSQLNDCLSGVGRWQSSEGSRDLRILPLSLIPTPSPWWAWAPVPVESWLHQQPVEKRAAEGGALRCWKYQGTIAHPMPSPSSSAHL